MNIILKKFLLLLTFTVALNAFELPKFSVLNERPVIGIIDLPVNQDMIRLGLASEGDRYIPAQYVRFFEMGGARIMIIPYHLPYLEKVKYFRNSNALFLAGGSKQGIHLQEQRRIFNWVKRFNQRGHFFPLFGICLGFEHIIDMTSTKRRVLHHFQVQDEESHKIKLINQEHSYLFKHMMKELVKFSEDMHGVYFTHKKYITRKEFQANKQLKREYFITSETVAHGKKIVSSFEGKHYPIVSMQFHPEKPIFWWIQHLDKKAILHNELSVLFGQHIADSLVQLARYDNRLITQDFAQQLLEQRNQTVYHMPGIQYTGFYIFRRTHRHSVDGK